MQRGHPMRLELDLRPLALGLARHGRVQPAPQREGQRDGVLGDRFAVAPARVRHDNRTLDRLAREQRPDAHGRRVDPLQAAREAEFLGAHPRRDDHVCRRVLTPALVGLTGVHDLVGRQTGRNPGNFAGRHGPYRRIVNRDDNAQGEAPKRLWHWADRSRVFLRPPARRLPQGSVMGPATRPAARVREKSRSQRSGAGTCDTGPPNALPGTAPAVFTGSPAALFRQDDRTDDDAPIHGLEHVVERQRRHGYGDERLHFDARAADGAGRSR